MKQELNNRRAIERMVDLFYEKARADELLGPVFERIIGAHWERHFPIMYDFWESILLGKTAYQGNPMQKHIEVDKVIRLEEAHFNRWVQLFKETVEKHFTGSIAEEAVKRAATIAGLMKYKVDSARPGNDIKN